MFGSTENIKKRSMYVDLHEVQRNLCLIPIKIGMDYVKGLKLFLVNETEIVHETFEVSRDHFKSLIEKRQIEYLDKIPKDAWEDFKEMYRNKLKK